MSHSCNRSNLFYLLVFKGIPYEPFGWYIMDGLVWKTSDRNATVSALISNAHPRGGKAHFSTSRGGRNGSNINSCVYHWLPTLCIVFIILFLITSVWNLYTSLCLLSEKEIKAPSKHPPKGTPLSVTELGYTLETTGHKDMPFWLSVNNLYIFSFIAANRYVFFIVKPFY